MSVRAFSAALVSLLVCTLLGILFFELMPGTWSIVVILIGLLVIWILLWTLLTRVVDHIDLF